MKYIAYLVACAVLYLVLTHLPIVNIIVLPVRLLCTFLHESGHALFALLSGGSVSSMAVNLDGSGVTYISGGSTGLITMGGYVGSALFGNIILRLANARYAPVVLKVVAVAMLICAFWSFNNLVTTLVLVIYAVAMWLLSKKEAAHYILTFLGIACVLYIIQDFNVGPGSDLQAYERSVGLLPAAVWMYVWLFLVLCITTFNVYRMVKKGKVRS